MDESENVTDQEEPVIEQVDEWREFNANPTPFITFDKEIEVERAEGDWFRAWIRLPNPFQHRKVQEHAQAARARRVMLHKDPESDVSAIISEKLAAFDEMTDDSLRDWLLDQHSPEAIFQAQIKLEWDEQEDGAGNKRRTWEDMPQHQERYALLTERSETDTDEYRKIEQLLVDYANALQSEANEVLEPYRAHYDALDREALMDKVRRALIRADCLEEFTNTYSMWQIFYGTRFFDNHNKQLYGRITDLLDEDGNVVEMLVEEFAKLDALKAGELKKSPRAISLLASLVQSEI